MPEIVEAEVIVNYLKKRLLGQKIIKINILNKTSFIGNPKKVINNKINKIERLGKKILFQLDNLSLLFHLKMTGQLIYFDKKVFNSKNFKKDLKYARVIFFFDKDVLLFNDIRKFGFVLVLKDSDLLKEKQKLGIDPLSEEFNFSFLKHSLSKSKKNIKNFLMDQKYISGLGNIYVNESLFISKIHPQSLSYKIPERKIKDLLFAIKKVLKEGLKREGSSINSYVKPDLTKGEYQNNFLVYKREGERCLFCKKSMILRIKISQRSSFYCPQCQKKFL